MALARSITDPKWRLPLGAPLQNTPVLRASQYTTPSFIQHTGPQEILDSMVSAEWVIQQGFTRVFMLFVSCFYFSLIGR